MAGNEETGRIDLFRGVLTLLLALGAILAAMAALPPSAAACPSHGVGKAEGRNVVQAAARAQTRERVSEKQPYSEPLNNRDDHCRCRPHHAGRAGVLAASGPVGPEKPAAAAPTAPRSPAMGGGSTASLPDPPIILFPDVLLRKSSLLI
ncbi:MAG: hypothetical protein V1816_21420 [Pseudomonadota bacterium]